MFKNLKAARDMMKNMDPDQLKDLMGQAHNYQKQLEETIRKVVGEEIEKRGLVSKEELEKRPS